MSTTAEAIKSVYEVEKVVEEGKINPLSSLTIYKLSLYTCSHQLIKLYKMQGRDSTQLFMWY